MGLSQSELNIQRVITTGDSTYDYDDAREKARPKLSQNELAAHLSNIALKRVTLDYLNKHSRPDFIWSSGDDNDGGNPARLIPLNSGGGPGAVGFDLLPIAA